MPVHKEGLDTLTHKLQDVSRRARELQGQQPALGDLFPPGFMQKHSEFSDIEAMLKAAGLPVKSTEELKAIPSDQLNTFVARSTKFQSWDAMQETAIREWALGKLGLK